jgi:hypothetical protein
MRSAVGMTIPFALVWAICGSILWEVILSQFGTTWPAFWQGRWLSLTLTLVYAVFGAIFAVGVRLFLWVVLERNPPRRQYREPPVRRDIKVAQDWREL